MTDAWSIHGVPERCGTHSRLARGVLGNPNRDGSEIIGLDFTSMSDHLMAEGGPVDLDQADVRVTLRGPELMEALQMDFLILY